MYTKTPDGLIVGKLGDFMHVQMTGGVAKRDHPGVRELLFGVSALFRPRDLLQYALRTFKEAAKTLDNEKDLRLAIGQLSDTAATFQGVISV